MIARFFNGLFFLKTGWQTLKQDKSLKRMLFFPLFIDLCLVVIFFTYLFSNISTWVTKALSFVGSGSVWFEVAYYPLLIIAWLAFCTLSLYAVFALSSIVASPFNALMAEKVLKSNGLIAEEKLGIMGRTNLIIKMFMVSMVKVVVFLIIGMALFILSFIPGVNIFSSFGIFLIFAFDSYDYAFEARNWSFKQRTNYFKNNIATASGMALMFALTLFIPGLTILILPFAIVGATQVMADQELR